MGWKITLSLFFFIFVFLSLFAYWFLPISSSEFISQFRPSTEIIQEAKVGDLQFYNNMRFGESKISYNIGSCPIAKRDEMIRAFELLENQTVLRFYPVAANEEISVICDSKRKVEGGLFIAGEGGPTNITKSGEFNVISRGSIFLFKESACENPNVALHELLHVLGFNHTSNTNDIMYPISKCNQILMDYEIELIDNLYFIPSYPDVSFEGVSASMRGKYLDLNISVRNNGLSESSKSVIEIYAEGSLVKEIDLDALEVGHGRVITLKNVWIGQFNTEELRIYIRSNFDELSKENNEAVLKIEK
jgi:hypothetical protein